MIKQKILIIVGPTASGKSALGVELAKKFNGEIVSADSRQVYRGLDIGTGKITKREMRGVRHHLLDVVPLSKRFSAHDFVNHAQKEISMIYHTGKLPIIVGGTGFYIDALIGRVHVPNVPPNAALRSKLRKKTPAQLYALLKKRDPKRARKMNTPSERNNKVRLIRALEIATNKKRTPSVAHRFDALWIGIAPKDKELRARISKRIGVWMRRGLIPEVKGLRKKGVAWKRLGELGFEYALVADYLCRKLSKEELPQRMERATWRYARKQIGYWKRNGEIRWFLPTQKKKIEGAVKKWLR
jgi:tRNA dimethylallyltransferase